MCRSGPEFSGLSLSHSLLSGTASPHSPTHHCRISQVLWLQLWVLCGMLFDHLLLCPALFIYTRHRGTCVHPFPFPRESLPGCGGQSLHLPLGLMPSQLLYSAHCHLYSLGLWLDLFIRDGVNQDSQRLLEFLSNSVRSESWVWVQGPKGLLPF